MKRKALLNIKYKTPSSTLDLSLPKLFWSQNVGFLWDIPTPIQHSTFGAGRNPSILSSQSLPIFHLEEFMYIVFPRKESCFYSNHYSCPIFQNNHWKAVMRQALLGFVGTLRTRTTRCPRLHLNPVNLLIRNGWVSLLEFYPWHLPSLYPIIGLTSSGQALQATQQGYQLPGFNGPVLLYVLRKGRFSGKTSKRLAVAFLATVCVFAMWVQVLLAASQTPGSLAIMHQDTRSGCSIWKSSCSSWGETENPWKAAHRQA